MTDTFQVALANIRSQQSAFEELDERAVEIGVVLPLLRRVGWDTENVSEVYPQHGLAGTNKTVDYDLQIDGESRVLIEVKCWGHPLNGGHESQLAGYCRLAQPSLAVLTSGRNWRLYLPPIKRKNAQLRRFYEFDITTARPADVASTFREFLARDRMSNVRPTVTAARKLYRESQAYETLKNALTEALSELAEDRNGQAELLQLLAEKKGITTSQENIERFIKWVPGPLVNEVPKGAAKTHTFPASFALPASPTGKKKYTCQVSRHNGWNNLLLEICELMRERHPENFRQEVLSITDRFVESKVGPAPKPIGSTGIFIKYGGSAEIERACYDVVARFGYPRESLVIEDSTGARL